MFDHYTKQAPQQGRTVPYTLVALRNPDGSSPVLHVEYLGESNRPYWLESLARAQAKEKPSGTTPIEIDRERRAQRDKNRATLAQHSVRRLEHVFRSDGTSATSADIPAVLAAIPDEDLDALWFFVQNPGNFRDYTFAETPAALAEK